MHSLAMHSRSNWEQHAEIQKPKIAQIQIVHVDEEEGLNILKLIQTLTKGHKLKCQLFLSVYAAWPVEHFHCLLF